MKTIGYCRVSTTDQTCINQKQAILADGFAVDEWYLEEGVSGSVPARERPEFIKMMLSAYQGSTCLVTHIDRLGRDAEDILNTINTFKARGIRLRVTTLDSIDVTSPTGKLIVTMLGGLAEMEKSILVERTTNGIARAREQGVKWGAMPKIEPKMFSDICKDKKAGMTLGELAEKYNFHKNTMQKYIARWAGDEEGYKREYEAKQKQHKKA
jgi:putative DNA-invertase from lambdoid prophage Rac